MVYPKPPLAAALVLLLIGPVLGYVDPKILDACPGYRAADIQERPDGLVASLVLRDKACNVFGNDIEKLKLTVVHESGEVS
jgi:alpha-glucosidase